MIGVQVIPSFDQFLTKTVHLDILNLSNCGLDAAAMDLICAALLENESTKMKELTLSNNSFGTDGAKALAQYLSSYEDMELLEISGC